MILNTDITKEVADREYDKIEKILGNLETETNCNIWKEMRKTFPTKLKPLPTGVKNLEGKLTASSKEKRKKEEFNRFKYFGF